MQNKYVVHVPSIILWAVSPLVPYTHPALSGEQAARVTHGRGHRYEVAGSHTHLQGSRLRLVASDKLGQKHTHTSSGRLTLVK